MTFEKRVAKIGKGFNVNLQSENDNKIAIYLFANSITKKILNTEHEKYELNVENIVLTGDEVIPLDENIYLVARQNNLRLQVIG